MTKRAGFGKGGMLTLATAALISLGACTTNPATGDQQFTALLPASQEESVGAQEHVKIQASFGNFISGDISNYVNTLGQNIAKNTERKDVQYKFYVIDSPMVNAFAVPGGYIYVTRGLMALANNEAELAAVIAHEIAHVTGRHAAERVSQGFLTSLGATVLAAAIDAPGVGRAAGLGSELYIKSYSRSQEHEADKLGVRYLHRAGYDPFAMASFLNSLNASTKLDQKIAGRGGTTQFNYFSTHPQTDDRVAATSTEAARYPKGPDELGRSRYFSKINGLFYGDSEKQGFVRGQTFYHPAAGFKFTVPKGFKISNQPNAVISTDNKGTVIVFDGAGDKAKSDPLTYLQNVWMRGEAVSNAQAVTINGMRAATAAFSGTVQGRPVTIRIVAIEWKPGQFFRFQIAIPRGATSAHVDELKRTTYSFARMSASEKSSIKPDHIRVVKARAGDTVRSMAAKMAFKDYQEDRFRVLNGLTQNETLVAGRQYKIIVN